MTNGLVEITNDNYDDFKLAPRAVLVATLSDCIHCETYKPAITQVTEKMPEIRFGEAVLDRGMLGKFKRDFPYLQATPTTIGLEKGREIFRFAASLDSPEMVFQLLTIMFERGQAVGRTVYWPLDAHGGRVPMIVTGLVDFAYHLKASENSPLGDRSTLFKTSMDTELPYGEGGKL